MKRKSQGFTLVELLVVMVVLIVIAAFLAPAVSAARGSARSGTCINNLRQIGIAISIYLQEHGDSVPFPQQILSYLDNRKEVLLCPEDRRPDIDSSYTPTEITPDSINPAEVTRPFSEMPLYIESDDVATTPEEKANIVVTKEPSSFANRHMNRTRSNILYLDCSVASFGRGQVLPDLSGGQMPNELEQPAD